MIVLPKSDSINGLTAFGVFAGAGGFVMASASLIIAAADRAPERLKMTATWNQMLKALSMALGCWFLCAFAFLAFWLSDSSWEWTKTIAVGLVALAASWGMRLVMWMAIAIQRFRTDIE